MTTAPIPAESDRRRRGSRIPLLPVDELASRWDLGTWLDFRRTDRGSTNLSCFLTTDRGRFVLRVSNSRKTESLIAQEVAFIDHLRTRGLPVPRVVPTCDGGRWAVVAGAFCLVTERLPGEFPDPSDPAHLAAVGRTLAQYHAATIAVPAAARPTAGSELPALVCGPDALGAAGELAARLLPAEGMERFRVAAALLEREFAAAAQVCLAPGDRLPHLISHGSLGYSAILMDGGEVTGVLDFERAAYEARALDLAYTVRGLCRSKAAVGAFDLGRLSRVVSAYRAVEDLPEVDLMPPVMRAQRLVKVRRKATNFVTQDGVVAQEAKDAEKLLEILETEVVRIRWLEEHEAELVAAMTAG